MYHNTEQFRAAIDELRPELQIRDQILSEFEHINDERCTYFATIAKDIYDIILSMIPSLRRSYATMDHSALILCMSEFLDKYMCGGHRPNYKLFDNCILSLEKLRHDFPTKFKPDDDYFIIGIKIINGQISIHPWLTNEDIRHNDVYLGEQFAKNSGLLPDIDSIYKRDYIHREMDALPVYILPCGLLVFRVVGKNGEMSMFLLDPNTMRRSKMVDSSTQSHRQYSCIDDNGTHCDLREHCHEILRFGPYGPEVMLFGLE